MRPSSIFCLRLAEAIKSSWCLSLNSLHSVLLQACIYKKKRKEKNFSHFGRGWGFSEPLHHTSRLLDKSQSQRSSTPPIRLLPTAGLSLPFPWALIPLLTTCQHCLSHSQEQHSLVLDESTSSTPPHPPTPHAPFSFIYSFSSLFQRRRVQSLTGVRSAMTNVPPHTLNWQWFPLK